MVLFCEYFDAKFKHSRCKNSHRDNGFRRRFFCILHLERRAGRPLRSEIIQADSISFDSSVIST